MTDRLLHETSRPASLPIVLTPFIGRERETARALELLGQDNRQLLTLTGPGGVGKTRLAIHIADTVRADFDEQVFFVSLANTIDPRLVLPTIAHAINLREDGDRSMVERLQQVFRVSSLLVLDNLEHVVAAAPDLADLLDACQRLKVMTTSRIPLRISAEQELPVAPLATPDPHHRQSPSALAQFDAVALFLERTHAVRPDFTLTDTNAATIAELCRRLDGLPLAIELAGARSKVLSPEALLARLNHRFQILTSGPADAPPRLRTMHAAIDWSYDLLTPTEQRIFCHLSVFANGFTEVAAGAIVRALANGEGARGRAPGAGSSLATDEDIFEIIASLVEKSLVEAEDHGTTRFRMLETIRTYGLEQLTVSGEESVVREAHASFWLAHAEHAAPALLTTARDARLRELEQEHDNLRAAFDWFAETKQGENLLRLTDALTWFWYFRGHLREGRERSERALRIGTDTSILARADALRAAARLALGSSNGEQSRLWGEESLRLYRDIGHDQGVGQVLSTLAALAEHRGDDQRAAELYEESWRQLQQTGPRIFAVNALNNVCDCAYRLGDITHAAEIADDALLLARDLGDSIVLTIALGNSGQVAISQGAFERARTNYLEGLSNAINDQHELAAADHVVGLAAVAAATGNAAAAARWFAAAQTAAATAGVKRFMHHQLAQTALETIRRRLDDGDFAQAWAEGTAITLSEAIAEVQAQADKSTPIGVLTRTAGPDRSAPSSRRPTALSAREQDVLRVLVTGNTDREIAAMLSISPRTAQVHVSKILAKLNVSSRSAAVAVALREGLVSQGPDDPNDVPVPSIAPPARTT